MAEYTKEDLVHDVFMALGETDEEREWRMNWIRYEAERPAVVTDGLDIAIVDLENDFQRKFAPRPVLIIPLRPIWGAMPPEEFAEKVADLIWQAEEAGAFDREVSRR